MKHCLNELGRYSNSNVEIVLLNKLHKGLRFRKENKKEI